MESAFGVEHSISKGLPSAAKGVIVPWGAKPKGVLQARKLAHQWGKEAGRRTAHAREPGFGGQQTSRYLAAEARQSGRNALEAVPGARAKRVITRRKPLP